MQAAPATMLRRGSGTGPPGVHRWRLSGGKLKTNGGVALLRGSARAFQCTSKYARPSYPQRPQYGQQPHSYGQFVPPSSQIYPQQRRSRPLAILKFVGLIAIGSALGWAATIYQYREEFEIIDKLMENVEQIEAELEEELLMVNGPLKDRLNWRREELTLHGATSKLKIGGNDTMTALSFANLPSLLIRYDTISSPSNSPCEDFMVATTLNKSRDELSINSYNRTLGCWGVFDGHAGNFTAVVLAWSLIPHVARELELLTNAKTEPLSPSDFEKALKTGFVRLDDSIIFNALNSLRDATSSTDAIIRIRAARAGSCALLALFDPETLNLHVACTGDSRAVLGRCSTDLNNSEATWTAVPLSEDQTGFNESECKRIAAEHPGENDIIEPKTGRLLGMAITRAFGDLRWKWPAEAVADCRERLWGQNPRPNYNSPPYMTAEPVVTCTKVQAGDFVILASDGLWDHISSENAVKCVEMWIKARASGELMGGEYEQTDTSTANEPLPRDWKMTAADFVVEDECAATHLVKNAFGGARRDLFRSAMAVDAPDSRDVRDDTSVQVIFFGGAVSSWLGDEKMKRIEQLRREDESLDEAKGYVEDRILPTGFAPKPGKFGWEPRK